MKTLILITPLIVLISFNQIEYVIKEQIKSVIFSDYLKNIEEQSKSRDSVSFYNLDSALLFPEKVVYLTEINNYQNAKHLPSRIGLLKNLKTLELACMEDLEDLPVEIGNLKKLEKLIINNGNGCVMNVSIPASIGQLQNLRELILYGALDARTLICLDSQNPLAIIKNLATEIGNLKNLEVLDLGRNGMSAVPNQIESLSKLKILRLAYNDIHEIPSFISKLTNLQELDIRGNGRIELPDTLSQLKKLKVLMGNDYLKLKDQKELKSRFPNIIFSFENEFWDSDQNEEPTI
jgi:Leucine-rich repeat (LRR) protein